MICFCQYSCCLLSALLIIHPLGFYSFAAFAGLLLAVGYYFCHRSIINPPKLAKLTIAEQLGKISSLKGISNIASFQKFNSRYHFLRKTFFHTRYVLVKNKNTKPYSGSVYNLSVWEDESYITRTGIAHNCRCFVTQTAELANHDLPDDVPEVKPEFRQNVGITEEVFPEKKIDGVKPHIYFAIAAKAGVKVQQEIDNLLAKETAKKAVEWGKENLVQAKVKLTHLSLPKEISLSVRNLKTITGKPHKNRAERNDLLYNIEGDFKDAEFIKGPIPEGKGRSQYKNWWYFKSKQGDFYYNVVESADGRIEIHAITDSVK